MNDRKEELVAQLALARLDIHDSTAELKATAQKPLAVIQNTKEKVASINPKVVAIAGGGLVAFWLVRRIASAFTAPPSDIGHVVEQRTKKGIVKGVVLSTALGLAKPYLRTWAVGKATNFVQARYLGKSSHQ